MISPFQSSAPSPPPPDFWDLVGTWLTTGNAPGWLAVLVAAGAATFAYRSSVAAQKQLKRLEGEDERELADGFTVWPTAMEQEYCYGGSIKPGDAPRREKFQDFYRASFELENAGEAVIYEAFFYVVANSAKDKEYVVGSLSRIPPRNRGHLKWSTNFPARFVTVKDDFGLGVIFRDAHQRYWDRTPSGYLCRLSETQARQRSDRMLDLSEEILRAIDWHGQEDAYRVRAHVMRHS